MSKYCEICFVDTEKEEHKDWCPNKPQDSVEFLKDMFGFNENKNDERRKEGDNTIND